MKAGLRRRLSLSVTAISAGTLIVLIVVFNVALRSSLNGDADRLVEARAQAALEGISVSDGRVAIGETSDENAPDAQVWIYSNGRNVERPLVDRSTDDAAASLAQRGEGTSDDPEGDTRFFAIPINDNESEVGMVVAGVSLEPYKRTAERALIGSIVLGALFLALIAAATRLVVNRALRPVARMTADAADWSEHDLNRRFNPAEPTDELTELAATFDRMLDRMAAMVRHERNTSAEISHELRTPLSSIVAEAEVALNRDRDEASYRHSLERISIRSREVSEILETLLSVARVGASDSAGLASDLDEALMTTIRSIEQTAQAEGVEIRSTAGTEPIMVQGGSEAIQRILSPVIENACAYATSTVTITTTSDPKPAITVLDDGPGFDASELERIFEPGQRGSAPRRPAAGPGTGLGLTLSRRLARAIGGEVEARAAAGHGGEIRVSFLRAPGSKTH